MHFGLICKSLERTEFFKVLASKRVQWSFCLKMASSKVLNVLYVLTTVFADVRGELKISNKPTEVVFSSRHLQVTVPTSLENGTWDTTRHPAHQHILRNYLKKHLKELKNNFVCKLNLLKKCSFLKKKSLLDLYFKVILPSVTYGITIWGNCNNLDYIKSLQALHCRAGRLIFNLPRDTPSDVVMELTQWDSIYDLYKLSLVKLFYNIVNDNIPSTISELAVWRNSPYDLRGYKKAIVPRFSTYFVKNSIRYRGAVLWNLVSDYLKDSYSFKKFYSKVQSDPKFREFRFICSWKLRKYIFYL